MGTEVRTGRRGFLGGVLAAGLVPKPSWADAGAPRYLSAAARPDGRFVLCGIGEDLGVRFQIPLPDRGHAAAAHPTRPEAVAFARRPGTFAVVIDCVSGAPKATLSAPAGRHFYGHGTFSADGGWLFTTENDYEAGRGRVGVWDVISSYARAAEIDSGGIGPHDIKRLPGGDVLVVANGGIDTHPDSGRTKLNLPTMAPNLAYLEGGTVVETAALPGEMHKNSIRHLAISDAGEVAFGMQWQGDQPVARLVGTHRRGAAMRLLETPPGAARAMQDYVGSIAFSADAGRIAVTSPRGGVIQIFDAPRGRFERAIPSVDACGIATEGAGFLATAGTGLVQQVGAQGLGRPLRTDLAWDNHLVRI
ncbi:MAG: DUF1513 domain-containing protein [Pseudomonadota bacterium]